MELQPDPVFMHPYDCRDKTGGRFNDYSVLHALLFLKNGMGMQSRIKFLGVLSTCSKRGRSIQTSHSKYSSCDVILVDCSQPHISSRPTCNTVKVDLTRYSRGGCMVSWNSGGTTGSSTLKYTSPCLNAYSNIY